MWKFSQHLHANNIIYATWGAFMSFFTPMKLWIAGCLFFVLADFITGLWVARRRGEMWSSKRFRESVAKAETYLFTLICARVCGLMVPGGLLNFELFGTIIHIQPERIAAAFICWVEFYSVLENFYKATGNRVFYLLTQITSRKLKDAAGVDVEKQETQDQDDKKC